MITTHVTINLTSQVSPQLIQAVQGDTGRSICFKLADFTIPAGAAATYYIQKPSGEAIYNSATISGNEITCELTAQSLAEIGENPMQVRISADGEIVTSFDAILLVRPFRGIGAIESSTEINIFDQAVEQAAEDFQEQAEEIAEEVRESIPADYTELTEEVDELNERLDNLKPGLSDEAKVALLACFENAAWADEHGQDYYDALEAALYSDGYPKLSATIDLRGHIVFSSDALDTLKNYLTVTYYEDASSAGVVLTPISYNLFGTLRAGSSYIRVVYNDASTSFMVDVVGVTIPTEYQRYDYIKVRDDFSVAISAEIPSGGMFFVPINANLNTLSYYTQFYAESALEGQTGGWALFGGRPSAGSTSSVALYYSQVLRWCGCHVHGTDPTGFTPPGVVQNDTVTEVSLYNGESSPSVLSVDGKSIDVSWTNTNNVTVPISILSNANQATMSSTQYMKKNLRLGNIDIRNVNDERVKYLVPVVRLSDNIIGIYDGVTGTFTTSQTSKYAKIGDTNCAYSVGDW